MNKKTVNKYNLSERHIEVLNAVVRQFVLTAQPVSSIKIAGKLVAASSSTIRNVMADLEAAGLLRQQYASSGRIPTVSGYRCFVDNITPPKIETETQIEYEKNTVEQNVTGQQLFERFAQLLASTSKLIAVVLLPRLVNGVLERFDIIQLPDDRLLLVVTLREGVVKTILIELPLTLSSYELIGLTRLLNERLSGLPLSKLSAEADARLADTGLHQTELVRIILHNTEVLFNQTESAIAGTGKVLEQPEFQDPQKVKAIIELLEGKDILLHLLESSDDQVSVKIGDEIGLAETTEISCVAANYHVGELHGMLGIIGPTRMDYPRQMALVGFAANLLSKLPIKHTLS
ncbi:MAG: heat-inducible transcriptional repressor HrcA [bacterium]|nr:heat-inducible transcriptional repressor HrcA [bacterium]